MIRLGLALLFLCAAHLLFSQVDDAPPDPATQVISYSEIRPARLQKSRANDPMITSMVAAISEDTLRKTLRQLQDWGSRCLLRDDHKEVAVWLKNKFLSYGYTNVKLDSFYLIVNWGGIYTDSSWQYNVVCTFEEILPRMKYM